MGYACLEDVISLQHSLQRASARVRGRQGLQIHSHCLGDDLLTAHSAAELGVRVVCSTTHTHTHTQAKLPCVVVQVNVLVSCGLTYSFPAEDSDHQLAPGYAAAPNQQLPRPAPISPAIDTLHVYSTLGQSGASTVKPAGSSMWGSKVMPLVLRQMMAQMISAANILRLDKVGAVGRDTACAKCCDMLRGMYCPNGLPASTAVALAQGWCNWYVGCQIA